MATPDTINVSQLGRLIGTPDAPVIIDVRSDTDHASDSRILPASIRHDHRAAASWAGDYVGRFVVVVCQRGQKLSQGAAAWLRHAGARAETLEGGFEAWVQAKGLLVRPDQVPARNQQGRTVWVTRARPKIDRIACPWLIRRFIDPSAVFLFVSPAEVLDVADRFQATPFDIDGGGVWSHRGALCTFDVMIEEFGLHCQALDRLALIVRAADTARLDLAPQAAGLLATSLGLSRMHRDDLAQLDATFPVYDALYRWARDATAEEHHWPTPSGGRS
ncbi:MAG: sulfurtransferase/chromate resistance protein [Acetobacteraceae bacterium]|nr:chromate resistance protein [Pseudomonadota bacterium]